MHDNLPAIEDKIRIKRMEESRKCHSLLLSSNRNTMFSVLLVCSVLVVVAQSAALSGDNLDIDSRVINGQLAQPNQLPWHAIVEGTQLNGNRTLCGGALISNTFVLTAAHCIFGTK